MGLVGASAACPSFWRRPRRWKRTRADAAPATEAKLAASGKTICYSLRLRCGVSYTTGSPNDDRYQRVGSAVDVDADETTRIKKVMRGDQTGGTEVRSPTSPAGQATGQECCIGCRTGPQPSGWRPWDARMEDLLCCATGLVFGPRPRPCTGRQRLLPHSTVDQRNQTRDSGCRFRARASSDQLRWRRY